MVKQPYNYATQKNPANKLILKYKNCINNMNRVITNEPSGSAAVSKEFNSIDPNANALDNLLSVIETEATHSKFDNHHLYYLINVSIS